MQFADLVELVRDCEGNVFPVRSFENHHGAWQLLGALAEVTNRRFYAKLEASEVLGLQVDESTDCGGSNNLFMALHYEVILYATGILLPNEVPSAQCRSSGRKS